MTVRFVGSTSGYVDVNAPAIAGTTTITLPASSGTLVVTGGTAPVQFPAGNVTNPSITFTTTTSTGVWSPAANTFAVSTGGSERMRIDSSGNVGFGVTPSYPLDVGGTIRLPNTASILFNNSSGTAVNVLQHYSDNVTYLDGTSGVIFRTSGANERMRITSGGTLDVGSSGFTDSRITAKSASTGGGDNVIRLVNSAGTELLRIRSDGVLYSGGATYSPYNNTTASAANMVVGASGDFFRSTSSRRYKKDIVDYDKGLAAVLSMRPVYYKESRSDPNKLGEGIRYAGLIAEEIDEAGLNEFVAYDNENRPDALHYGNMVAVLINAVKEQQAQIKSLEARIAALENA